MAVQAAIPAAERQVLLDLYTSTHGDAWTDHSGWNGAPGTECTWYGITCDDAGEHVTEISLSFNHLDGSLSSLDGLTNLQGFYASSNQLTGPIPSLAGLASLNYFYVSDNRLRGPVPPVPSPSSLQPGGSQLCSNYLDPVPDADWDAATGETPWYQNCGPADTVFADGFDP